MRYIDKTEIRRSLNFDKMICAIEDAHSRPRIEIQDAMLGTESSHYFVRHAVDAGRFMASKLITSFPSNLSRGVLPAIQAICVLFDGQDGRPLVTVDGTEITYWRTAADSAVGAKILARPGIETMLVVGAGEMSRWLVRAHSTAHPTLRRIRIWNRTSDRAAHVAGQLRDEGFDAISVTDLDEAVSTSDLITTCTRSHTPLIKGALLRPGTHLDLVGGYTEKTRESDDDAMRRSRVFVDRFESAFAGVGDILTPIAAGVIDKSDVLGDLYDLIQGKVQGRTTNEDITVYKNAGGGHFDLIAAVAVFESSVEDASAKQIA
ncbi:dehydrogenase [Bosea vestrisii]|uniref:ornithine cyclodeaminase family protein n=1 Tax=Bosea vestrisii TaxID=151416 RepID=UPI0024DF9F77|nr:dehydrogenase [Bosea vestrisii]WID95196.1 dehydrogenase [Bosea vestrisii]